MAILKSSNTMDPETGCGLPSTGQNVRLLIGAACGFWYSIGQILATAVRPLAWLLQTSIKLYELCYSMKILLTNASITE